MRTKPLEATYYIPNKLIKSLSTTLSSTHYTTVSGEKRCETRIEKEVQIRLENDVPKHGINDSILVNAVVIWVPLAGSSLFLNLQSLSSSKDSSDWRPGLRFTTKETSSWLMKSTTQTSRSTLSFIHHFFLLTQLSKLMSQALIGRWQRIGRNLDGLLKSMLRTLPTL